MTQAITAGPVPDNHGDLRISETGEIRDTRLMEQWIREMFRKHPGKTRVALARELGVDASAVSKMTSGVRDVKRVEVPIIERFFGEKAPSQENEGDQQLAIKTSAFNTGLFTKDVPVYRMVAGGMSDNVQFDYNTGEVIDLVRRPTRLNNVSSSYGLFVVGDTMVPWREPGQLIYINPAQPHNVGDYVVVQLRAAPNDTTHGTPTLVKKLVGQTDKELTLLQHNPRKTVNVPRSRVKSISKIMEWTELMTA